jgi:hypothetical protein
MREIPQLQILCLRAIGSHACSVEDTFAPTAITTDKNHKHADDDNNNNSKTTTTTRTEEPSSASRVLRSMHQRPIQGRNGEANLPPANPINTTKRSSSDDMMSMDDDKDTDEDSSSSEMAAAAVTSIPLARTPCIGKGSARRDQSNDIDLNHPIVGCRRVADDPMLILEYGNVALDCLQSYIDSLVELGRMDDTRLGVHFFDEWKANVILGSGQQSLEEVLQNEKASAAAAAAAADSATTIAVAAVPTPSSLSSSRKKKRRRSSSTTPTTMETGTTTTAAQLDEDISLSPPPLGSLSLYNCSLAEETIGAMVTSGMGQYLGVLDLTGINSLTDDLLSPLLPTCPWLEKLSLKNCRRLSRKSIQLLQTYQQKSLHFLDVGGSYNIHPTDLIGAMGDLPHLHELHASGLAWTNELVTKLMETRPTWTGLSLGFLPQVLVTATPFKEALLRLGSAPTLQMLALPFCESLVDNAFLGMLGRQLPNVICLDVRGNSSLTSLTGWYDGRASSADGQPLALLQQQQQQPLTVLARYSGVSKSSLDETKRIHPLETNQLVCILDGSGVGLGVRVVGAARSRRAGK